MRSFTALCFLVFALTAAGSAQDTVHVKSGWNIIGSVKAGAVPEVLSTVPDTIITTAFFGYNPGTGYESTDTLGKGLGYWVKVNADGIIVFNTSISDLCGAKRVTHGGKIYHTVQIGSQCWLEENMNVGTMVTGVIEQTNNAVLEKYCYNNDPANCALYGGLYQWNEAMQYVPEGAQGICPPGWHIPTNAEFQTLSTAVGNDGNALKAVGQGTGSGAGTNTSGFSALVAGVRYHLNGSFSNLGNYTYFWSSAEFDATIASSLGLFNDDGSIPVSGNIKNNGFSVRCLED